jgi:hypothetical protein
LAGGVGGSYVAFATITLGYDPPGGRRWGGLPAAIGQPAHMATPAVASSSGVATQNFQAKRGARRAAVALASSRAA